MREPAIKEIPRCPLSLRPNERVMDAYVRHELWARDIIEAWSPARVLRILTLPASEFDALVRRQSLTFTGE